VLGRNARDPHPPPPRGAQEARRSPAAEAGRSPAAEAGRSPAAEAGRSPAAEAGRVSARRLRLVAVSPRREPRAAVGPNAPRASNTAVLAAAAAAAAAVTRAASSLAVEPSSTRGRDPTERGARACCPGGLRRRRGRLGSRLCQPRRNWRCRRPGPGVSVGAAGATCTERSLGLPCPALGGGDIGEPGRYKTVEICVEYES
jgi:hypothetical protein